MAATSRLLSTLVLTAAVVAFSGVSVRSEDIEEGPDWIAIETAALTVGPEDGGADLSLPRVLGPADVERYGRIYKLQDEGHWKDADRLIARLSDRSLVGHVLAERYLHPKYRSSFAELRDWLEHYADQPDAQRIYQLAMKRKPANARPPRAPVAPAMPPLAEIGADNPDFFAEEGTEPTPLVTDRARAEAVRREINALLKQRDPKAAQDQLDSDEARAALSAAEVDRLQARIAAAYLSQGSHESALKAAGSAAARTNRRLPEAHWTAGLAAWRLGRYDEAKQRFATVATTTGASPWLISAGAFWAGRAALKDGKPEEYNDFMRAASQHSRTFYGLLALRVLGHPMTFSWSTPGTERAMLNRLTEVPSGRRVLGLAQVGRLDRAERELQILAINADGDLARGIVALASRAGMASLSMRLARQMFPDGDFDAAFYPIPAWTPPGGYRVDRALIYALMRQESSFNPRAKSVAGARGLMQLMPATANFVARAMGRGRVNRDDLLDPVVNLEYAQRYIEILLAEPKIAGDLFQLAAAYNAGPGNLAKWWTKSNLDNDPLFFIESLPARETRNFIEQVLANYWIYRDRLGQPTPSLDALAQGDWPLYPGQDRTIVAATRNVQDRR